MVSQVGNPDMAAAIDAVASGLVALRRTGSVPVDAADAVTCIRELEMLRRAMDSACVDLMGSIDTERFHLADGHSSAKVMVRHHAQLSNAEALGRQRMVRMTEALPEVGDAYRRGQIGTDQVRAIASVYANPRVRDAMPAKQASFLREANIHDFTTFEQRLQQWRRLTDVDGPTPPNQKAHEDRNARMDQDFDLAWHLVARFASAQGVQIAEIFDHYIQAETLVDWEKARANHGEIATVDDLPRTIRQRRADALWQIFIDAAANPNTAVPADFVHNIIWDADTFEHLAAKILGEDHHNAQEPGDEASFEFGSGEAPSLSDDSCLFDEEGEEAEASLFDGLDPDHVVCRTINGTPVEPTEMMIHALINKIRRVVITAHGEKVDLGRARFFTGMARHAVKLKATTCVWPGCKVPSSACQTDHVTEHHKHGRTNPGNGVPLCGKHNRWKHQGFTIYRIPDGTWHITRPDGTPIPTPSDDHPPLLE